MSIQVSFGGAQIKRPGAYSVVDTARMTPVTTGSLKTLAVIGELSAGSKAPADKVSFFNDPKEASEAVGEGDVLEVMRTAWGHGADLIGVVPVKKQATDKEWQKAIDLLQTEFVSGIIPITTEAAILTKVAEHVVFMSTMKNRRRRRAFYGHAPGLDVHGIQTAATPLYGERGVLATPCPLMSDVNGELKARPSYFTAAAVAGLWAGSPSQEPVTYKKVKFVGFEKQYTMSEIEALLEAHLCPIEIVKNNGFRVVQGLTLSSSTDLTLSELSVSTLKDDMVESIETYFENKYVGKAGVPGIEVTMRNDLVSLLQNFQKQGWIREYVDDSIQVRRNGTSFYLEWEGKPTLPINNFFITSHFSL